MAVNKVVYNGRTLIDLTDSNVTPNTLTVGTVAYDASGNPIEGTVKGIRKWEDLANNGYVWVELTEKDSNTQDANATSDDILLNKTAYVKAAKVTGTMPNKGAVNGTINTKSGSYTVPKGYHNGSGKVQIDSAEQAKIIPENIREGVNILGVTGTMVSKTYQDYQQLEYIESTGTQYINTGFKPNQDTGVTIDFQLNSASAWQCVFGARTGNNTKSYSLWHSGTAFGFYYANANSNFSNLGGTSRHTVNATKNTAIADGTNNVSLAYSNFTADYTMCLFAINSDGTAQSNASMKLYACRIYDNGVLVRDFVPARYYNGEVGLWDLVEGKFYGNAGTGKFSPGLPTELTLPNGYTKLDYIQSTGTQYIDTGFTPNQDTRVVATFETQNSNNDWRGVFGARNTNGNNQSFSFFLSTSNVFTPYYGNNKSLSISGVSVSGKHTVDYNKNTVTVDGVTQTFAAQTFTSPCSLCLCAVNTTGGNNGVAIWHFLQGKIYSCRIYDNGTLVRDYIPCVSASEEVGLYDLVNGVFYGNKGSGTFSYG